MIGKLKVRSISSRIPLACLLLFARIAVPKPAAGTLIPIPVEARVESFVETRELGLTLQPLDMSGQADLPKEIKAADYSIQYAQHNLLPALAGSFAVGDVDNDGSSDIFVVSPDGSNRLFHNDGHGSFHDLTAKAGLASGGTSVSATFADYDNSGRVSLFTAGLGALKVYRNKGNGTFVDETQKAGLHSTPGVLYTRIVFVDIDDDGFPDLLATAYTDLAAPPSKAMFVFPNDFPGQVSHLYRNNGNGTFSDITASAGLDSNPGRARSAVSSDFDGDGRQDLLILRDDKPPILYRNRGGRLFEDFTYADEQLSRNAFFDAQVADFNHDGKPDLGLWSSLASRPLLNHGGGRFLLASPWPKLASLSSPFGFHGTVVDINGDGSDDLLVVDSRGQWRLLLNHEGQFQETRILAPTNNAHIVALNALAALRLVAGGPLYLLGLQSNGQILVLKRQM